MCRLAAFPPGFQPHHAASILYRFAKSNTDGTGSVYVKDGEFKVNKWPLSLSKVMDRDYPLLSHMPHNGWTVVHLRAASHGGNTKNNTHPFIKGKWAVVHNGIWSEYELVKEALKKHVNFDGETDSEVAAHLLATVGPKKFSKLVTFGGVYLALNKNGELWAVKTSGDLEMASTKKGMLLASELPKVFGADEQDAGWMHFDKTGKLISEKHPRESFKDFTGFGGGGWGFIPPGMEITEEATHTPHFNDGHLW